MPVSPQDFALWSNLTGNPYPQTPAERMALAPEVYTFTRNLGRGGGQQMGGVRRAVDVIGKAALAAGALAGAAYLSAEGYKRLQLDDEPGVPAAQEPAANPLGRTAAASGDITKPTTAQNFQTHVVPNQTTEVQIARGVSPAKPTVVDSEEKPATQSQVITSSQSFSPGTEIEQLEKAAVPYTPVRDRADELVSEFLGLVKGEQRQQAQIEKGLDIYGAGVTGRGEKVLKQVLKEGRQEGISPIGLGAVRAAESFRQTPQYSEMMRAAGASTEPEEMIGGPTQPAVFTKVRPTLETRITGAEPEAAESPIVAMAQIKKPVQTPSEVKVTAPAVAAVPERRSAEAEAQSSLAAKAFALMPKAKREALIAGQEAAPIVTSQPEKTRLSEELGGVTEKLLRQAKSMRTSREEAGGMFSQDIPNSPVQNITVSPSNEVAVTYKTKAGAQTYNFDADPKYVNELVERMQKGSFVKGQDSAGGFINAGRSMGLLQ